MLVVFKNVKQKNVLACDIEYDNDGLMQFAGLLFKRVDKDNDVFQLSVSFNKYVKKDSVNKYAERYTGITYAFLQENGVEIKEFTEQIEDMFEGIKERDTLFVSHGAKNDRKMLKQSGIKFMPGHSYCTYKNAKKLLGRPSRLKLGDVAEDSGFFLGDRMHDAFTDAWATVSAFSFLKKIEYEKSL